MRSVLALLNTECLKRKNPGIIKKIGDKFPKQKGRNLLKELYSEIIKTENDSRLILNEFYLKDLYNCLDKPKIDIINNTFTILQFKSIRESFKLDLFCLTFNFDKSYVEKKVVLKKRILKSFLELTMLPSPLKYVDFIKFFLHDSSDTQNDYLLWYYKLIKFDITEKDYKNFFGMVDHFLFCGSVCSVVHVHNVYIIAMMYTLYMTYTMCVCVVYHG